MLTLDLARLAREDGQIHLRRRLGAEEALFEGADLPLKGGLTVDLRVSRLESGQIMVRGEYTGVLARRCRRCLEPVEVSLDEGVALVFAPRDELGDDPADRDDEIRGFNSASGEIDLAGAIREEVILSAPLYVECKADCRGLCPKCGTNQNESSCECTLREEDPRWDALRQLQTE